MKIYACKYCGRETDNKQSHCRHQGSCSKNPKRQLSAFAWNRGLSKETDPRVAKYAASLSTAFTGRPSNKGYKWPAEVRERFSTIKKASYLAGRSKPYGRAKKQWFYCQKLGRDVYLKSSWEVTFARYCDAAGIPWEYEAVVLVDSDGKTWHPDFLVNGALYDPGWQNKQALRSVCEENGYEFHHVTEEEIRLMKMFL